jgi:hypothetical protein
MIAELPHVLVVTPLGEESQGVFVSGKGVLRMLLLSRYKRKELPHRLIRIHESLVEDMIAHFEKGRITREKMKEARKALKLALKLAKKKKINPGVKITQAREVLEELREEVQYTRKVVRATAEEMEKAIQHIEEERIGEVQALIDRARERFRNKEIEKGLDLLKEAQGKMTKKVLDKTRQAILAGIHSEVKKLKYELEERSRKKASK